MRKCKIDFETFVEFLEKINNSYYDNYRATLTKKSGERILGTAYKISKNLTEDNKKFLLSWKNVTLFISQCAYAPEIKNNVVFIADKCIR